MTEKTDSHKNMVVYKFIFACNIKDDKEFYAPFKEAMIEYITVLSAKFNREFVFEAKNGSVISSEKTPNYSDYEEKQKEITKIEKHHEKVCGELKVKSDQLRELVFDAKKTIASLKGKTGALSSQISLLKQKKDTSSREEDLMDLVNKLNEQSKEDSKEISDLKKMVESLKKKTPKTVHRVTDNSQALRILEMLEVEIKRMTNVF